MDRILSLGDIAKLFGCSKKDVIGLHKKQGLPLRDIGETYVSSESQLLQWVNWRPTGHTDGPESGSLQSALVKPAGYEDYFEYTAQERGFNPYAFGDWQRFYAEMMDNIVDLKGKKILDVGCAGGATTFSFHQRGALVSGCDINREIIRNTPFTEIRQNLFVVETDKIADFFDKNSFRFIHSQQVFEHFPSREYSERVVKACCALMAPGALLYVALVAGQHLTAKELIDIKKSGTDLDITHINIWPLEYWKEVFESCGFVNVEEWLSPILKCYQSENGFSFFREYHWDQFFYLKEGDLNICEFAKSRLQGMLERQKKYADKSVYREVLSQPRVNQEMLDIIGRYTK